MIDVFKQFQGFKKDNVILSFRGEVSFELVKAMLDNIETRLDIIEPVLKTRKKIFNVLVEVYQNLCHHIETGRNLELIDQGKMAIMTLSCDRDFYKVSTGNYIMNQSVAELDNWLHEINQQDDKSLRGLYKEILNNETYSRKGGGGLGFIDISRKSGSKMEYKFHKIDKEYSFFEFNIKVPKEN